MAFLLKNAKRPTGSSTPISTIDQWIQVRNATNTGAGVALPATTTGQLFRVRVGAVLVRALVGRVTTAIQNQACNYKISIKQLTAADVAVGTAVDISANVSVANQELGGFHFIEGDGTAGVLSTAGGALIGANSGNWIASGPSEIYATTSATNTGAMIWDLWYQPLDAGAYVEMAPLTAAGILTAAI